MYAPIANFIQDRLTEFSVISDERKSALKKLADYISQQLAAQKKVNLIYICTHNSRRSHFGQIAAAVASVYYQIPDVITFSGGTEATTFNINAINALRKIGFNILQKDDSINPVYEVRFSDDQFSLCFSKRFDDAQNPDSNFAAIMTCSDADENCPFIPGADIRIKTTYEDPKSSDGTGMENKIYTERFAEILRDNLYTFSLIKTQ
jgi:arsenate reductase